MGEDTAESGWFRIAFGRPRLWNGVVWMVFAVCWLAVTVSSDETGWGYFLAAFWAIVGAVVFTIALRDLRRGHGAYVPTAVQSGD